MAGLSFEMTIWRLFCCQPQVVQLHYSLVDDIILIGASNADWRKMFILSSGDNDCLTTPAVTHGGDHSNFFSGYQSHVVEFFMPKENYDSSLVQGTILAGTGSFFTLLLLSRNYIFVSINTTLHNIDNYCSQTKETQTMKNNEIKSKKYQQHGANIFSSTCQLM